MGSVAALSRVCPSLVSFCHWRITEVRQTSSVMRFPACFGHSMFQITKKTQKTHQAGSFDLRNLRQTLLHILLVKLKLLSKRLAALNGCKWSIMQINLLKHLKTFWPLLYFGFNYCRCDPLYTLVGYLLLCPWLQLLQANTAKLLCYEVPNMFCGSGNFSRSSICIEAHRWSLKCGFCLKCSLTAATDNKCAWTWINIPAVLQISAARSGRRCK